MIQFLDKIVNYLKQHQIILNNLLGDGRLNSAENESAIINLLNMYFNNIEIPKIRSWYDFKLTHIDKEIFINIKISDLNNNSADNISSKLGMGYALTGITNMSHHWEIFHNQIKQGLTLGYDYYFLIINKQDTQDIFWTSLKRIETLVPNGNNLPFQCVWNRNRNFSKRNEKEAIYYILEQYIASWDKKINYYPQELKDLLKISY
ncbi:TPA: restriction endonuclease [Campylobacter jejuni]